MFIFKLGHYPLLGLSTFVENPLQIELFIQNKPNFMRFCPNNADFKKKRTQNKPNFRSCLPLLHFSPKNSKIFYSFQKFRPLFPQFSNVFANFYCFPLTSAENKLISRPVYWKPNFYLSVLEASGYSDKEQPAPRLPRNGRCAFNGHWHCFHFLRKC